MGAMLSAKPWRRWQDWVSLAAGIVLALSTLWVDVDTLGRWAMVVIGAGIGVAALIGLAVPGAYVDESIAMVLGIAAFLAPWTFSFVGNDMAAATAWIVGVVVAAMSGIALPRSLEVHRNQPAG
jgi:hypothetical protein